MKFRHVNDLVEYELVDDYMITLTIWEKKKEFNLIIYTTVKRTSCFTLFYTENILYIYLLFLKYSLIIYIFHVT